MIFELQAQKNQPEQVGFIIKILVGMTGFEPATPDTP